MALSDCPKCWNTPCTCGYEYKDYCDMSEFIAGIMSYHTLEKQLEFLHKAENIIKENKNETHRS